MRRAFRTMSTISDRACEKIFKKLGNKTFVALTGRKVFHLENYYCSKNCWCKIILAQEWQELLRWNKKYFS